MEEVMDAQGIPAVAVTVVTADSALWTSAWGVADREEGRPADTATVFRAGSVSKSALAVTLLTLIRDEELAHDTPVRDVAPEVPLENRWTEENPVRLVHLMEHTSGFDDLHPREYAVRDPHVTLSEALEFHPASRRVRWPPGAFFAYSNAGPPVAARMAEVVEGRSFEEVVETRLFEPLGMETASFRLTERVEERIAAGYGPDGRSPVPYAHILARPSGALNLTVGELGIMVRLLLGRGQVDGVELLPESLVAWMERPATGPAARAGLQAAHAFGVTTSVEGGFPFVGHAGSIDGFRADFGYLPDEGVGYALMANSTAPGFQELRSLVRRFAVAGLDPPAPPATASPAPGFVEAQEGYYERITPRLELTRFAERLLAVVRVEGTEEEGRIRIAPLLGAPRELVATGPRTFRDQGEPVATVGFLTDDGGRVILTGTGAALHGNYAPVATWGVWTRWGTAIVVLAFFLSGLVLPFVWGFRFLHGRSGKGGEPDGRRLAGELRALGLPAAAAWSLVLAATLPLLGGPDLLVRMGTLTLSSAGFFVLTVLFAVLSLAGLLQALRVRTGKAPGWARNHALFLSGAHLLILVYLALHGLVGARLWAA